MSTEEADVRTIHIPAPTHTARLIVRKRLDQHLTGDRLVSGQRGSAPVASTTESGDRARISAAVAVSPSRKTTPCRSAMQRW